ncbi:MAG: hypothetical protein C0402_07595 [Thermodesulfovibrio sp.]|nr:hypothetical protein [Thermodesulfovibrio sp.]
MRDRQAGPEGLPAELDFLMFSSAGVSMAVEAAQVEGILSPEAAELRGISCGLLSEILGMGCETTPASLRVLLYRDQSETCGVGVDRLESIVPLPVAALRLLPELLLSPAGQQPFWGAVVQGEDVILLIDLYRLKGLKSYKPYRVAAIA